MTLIRAVTACAVAAAVCLATAVPAAAYVRSRTKSGLFELYWAEDEFVYHLDAAGSDDLPGDQSELDAIRAGFATWAVIECPYGPFRMTPREGTLLTDPAVEYVDGGPNRNVLRWVEDRREWFHSLAVIGVTSATYDARNGRVLDADVEFNGIQFTYTTSGSPLSIRTDVQNTATHEVGHFLGLDHTPVDGATMEARAPDGETRKRTLAPDDVEGVCAVVPPPGAEAPPAAGEPGDVGGCVCGRIAPASPQGPPWSTGPAAPLLIALALGLARRRYRGAMADR